MSFLKGLFGPPDIEKLKAMGDVQGLTNALNYPKDENVRKAATKALSELRDAHAVESLIAELVSIGADEDPSKILDEGDGFGYAMAKKADEKKWKRRAEIAKELGHLGMPAFESLIALLKDPSKKVPPGASSMALSLIGVPAIKPLINLLNEPQQGEVQKTLIEALQGIHDITATESLVSALIADDYALESREKILKAVGNALTQIGMPAEASLLEILKDNKNNNGTRIVAIRTLGIIKSFQSVELLINILQNENLRSAAIYALGNISDSRAVEPLIAVLEHNDECARDAIAALGEIGDLRAVEPIVMALNRNNNRFVRRSAIAALEKIGDSRAVEPLIAVALKHNDDDDEDENVRKKAITTLEKIGDSRAIEPLIAVALGHSNDKYVRKYAINALGMIGDLRAVEPLITLLTDYFLNEYVAVSLKLLLAKYGQDALNCQSWVEPLIGMHTKGQWKAKEVAADLLGLITSQQFGRDSEKWQKWWADTNKK